MSRSKETGSISEEYAVAGSFIGLIAIVIFLGYREMENQRPETDSAKPVISKAGSPTPETYQQGVKAKADQQEDGSYLTQVGGISAGTDGNTSILFIRERAGQANPLLVSGAIVTFWSDSSFTLIVPTVDQLDWIEDKATRKDDGKFRSQFVIKFAPQAGFQSTGMKLKEGRDINIECLSPVPVSIEAAITKNK